MRTPRFQVACLALALAVLGSACASSTAMSGAATNSKSQDLAAADAGQASADGTGGWSNTGATGTGAFDSSSDASSSGLADSAKMTPSAGGSTDQGIGLKPGGAQDINYFRMKVAAKTLPKSTDMTLEGWLNEHDTVLPKALSDRVVTLHAMAALIAPAAGQGQADTVIQLGLNSGKTLSDVSDPIALTVVLDRSGSMSGEKLADIKVGMHALIKQLPKNTLFSFVTFSSDVQVDMPPTLLDDASRAKADQVIDAVIANGGTNLHDALQQGETTCKSASAEYKIRRILLLSDGQPTVGDTQSADITAVASASAAAGCSISTVGVGYDFDPQLMTNIAQIGGGTGWFLPDAQHSADIFIQDLETLLLPVADKLTLQFKLASGWKVTDIYGFEWAQNGDQVNITGVKQPPAPVDGADAGSGGSPDAGSTDSTQEAPVAMPTLFASKRNGLVMIHLAAPQGEDLSKIADLLLATVTYSYHLAKSDTTESFDVPVQVPGLVAIPDGGIAYFGSPIVHRAWLLLHDGLALQQACAQVEGNGADKAKQLLQDAIAKHDAELATFAAADLLTVDASQPDLADAKVLMQGLLALIP